MVSKKGGESMRKFVRLCRAERYKMRHTMIPVIHMGIPLLGSAVFLLYYKGRDWTGMVQLSGFTQIIGLLFPVLISFIVSRSVELEEGNHYQTFLGGNTGRIPSLLAKCVVLQLFGLAAVSIGISSFALGERVLLGNCDIPCFAYFSSAAALWLGSLVLYPIHFFFGMRFSKSVSMGIGVAQSVMAGLLITGLGEGLWQFVPSSWSIRLVWTTMKAFAFSEKAMAEGAVYDLSTWRYLSGTIFLENLGYICLLISMGICAIIFLWFYLWGDTVAFTDRE